MVLPKFSHTTSLPAFDKYDIWLQTKIKSTFKGQRFANTVVIQNNLLLVWITGPEDLSSGGHC